MNDRHEIRMPKGATAADAEAAATRWLKKGWHGAAQVSRKSGPGTDLYGPYMGRWFGMVRGTGMLQTAEVTVRPAYTD